MLFKRIMDRSPEGAERSRKRMKKLSALLMALLMVWSLMGGASVRSATAEQADSDISEVEDWDEEAEDEAEDEEEEEEEEEVTALEARDLAADQETEIVFAEGETVYLRFVPKAADGYTFFSLNNNEEIDPMGYLYDDEMELITANDDDHGNVNFRISYLLERGKTYYFACEIVGETEGSYPVKLEKTAGLLGLVAEKVPETLKKNMKLTVRALATKGTKVSYRWYAAKGSLEDGESIEDLSYDLIGKQNKATLTVAAPEVNAAYCCIAEDAAGNEKMVYFYLEEDGITVFENEMTAQEEEEPEEDEAEEEAAEDEAEDGEPDEEDGEADDDGEE